MLIPFTRDQFFGAFSAYNQAIWPAQIGLLLGAVVIAGVAWRQEPPRWTALALSGLWIWTAAVYHIGFFVAVTSAAYLFAAGFAAQAALIAWHGPRMEKLQLGRPREPGARALGWALVLYGIVGYPVIALLAGQRYPAMPTFGAPCPATIFTLGVLCWTRRPIPWTLLAIPLAWSLIATSAALAFGVVEDLALPLAAVAVLADQRRRARRGVVTGVPGGSTSGRFRA